MAQPERETFEGALRVGRMALEELGIGRYEARERADLFRCYNQQMVDEMADGDNFFTPGKLSMISLIAAYYQTLKTGLIQRPAAFDH
ncbi:Glutathione-regulated potassium-efflux system protein KefC [Cronobacter muytjensii 530]